MVSSAINVDLQALWDTLERFRVAYAADAEYAELRGTLPADWPL